MPSAKGERAVVAFAWVVNAGLAVVVAVAFGKEWLEWGVATAFTAVTIGTGGRPALVMDEVIELKDDDGDRPLRRRRRVGLIVLMVAIFVFAAASTDW